MSDLKKIKEEFLIKLKSKINPSQLNQILFDLPLTSLIYFSVSKEVHLLFF